MNQAAHFTLTRDGIPVSQQRFHRVGNVEKAANILNSMSSSSRTSFRRGLKIDFGFAPFFYGLMICLSILIRRNAADEWNNILHILCWVPLAIWLCDVLEDSATLSLLNNFEEKGEVSGVTTAIMAVSSWLKWIIGIAWLVIMISLAIASAVQHWR